MKRWLLRISRRWAAGCWCMENNGLEQIMRAWRDSQAWPCLLTESIAVSSVLLCTLVKRALLQGSFLWSELRKEQRHCPSFTISYESSQVPEWRSRCASWASMLVWGCLGDRVMRSHVPFAPWRMKTGTHLLPIRNPSPHLSKEPRDTQKHLKQCLHVLQEASATMPQRTLHQVQHLGWALS